MLNKGYTLEEMLPDHFIKINQSCIVNKNVIKGFEAAFSGSLLVRLKNGHIVVCFVVWTTVYLSVKGISKKMNEKL